MGWVAVPVPSEAAAALRAGGVDADPTAPEFFLACLSVVMWRLSGERTVCVGLMKNPGPQLANSDAIGVPIRVVLHPEASFGAFRGQLHEEVARDEVTASRHGRLTLAALVEALGVTTAPLRHPVFQWRVVYHDRDVAVQDDPGPDEGQPSAPCDVSFLVRETTDGWTAGLQYRTDVLSPESAGQLASYIANVVAAATSHSGRLGDLRILDQEERNRLLEGWNATTTTYRHDQTIHGLLKEQATMHPSAPALECGSQVVSFGELNARANQLAHYLIGRGVGPGTRVGICLERSCEAVAFLLGVLKSGASFVPLDPNYPAARLSFMLRDSGARFVMTRNAEQLTDDDTAEPVLVDDRFLAHLESFPHTNPEVEVSPDDHCYVVYTSGSTGHPKGVPSVHRGLVCVSSWSWSAYPFRPGEVAGQCASWSFVIAYWELFMPLMAGTTVAIVPDAIVKDTAELVTYLAEHQVTRVLLVPSLVRVILDTVDDLRHRIPSLDHWSVGGEALPMGLARRFREQMPDVTLLNQFGSSETHLVAVFEVGDLDGLERVPIGRPIANRRVYVLNDEMEPMPPGIPGQLFIAGDGLASGYLNQEELTRERFMADHLRGGATMLRTGDRAMYLHDGNILHLGRIDNQLKIRGFRVESEEVELTLCQHSAVRQSVVALDRSSGGAARLVAYIVPVDDMRPSVSQLQDHVRASLPEHMVPSLFVSLERIPTTPNGKVDRSSLPAPGTDRPQLDEPFAPPSTDTERIIAAIWCDVLKLESIGLHDDFFELGGYSNKAIQVITQVRNRFEIQLPLRMIFESKTVAGLSARVDALRSIVEPRAPHAAGERETGDI